MKKLIAACLMLVALEAKAETLNNCFTLSDITDRTTSLSDTVAILPNLPKRITLFATADNDSGTTPTLDLKVQTCKTSSSSSCTDLASFDQCTTGSCWSDTFQGIDLSADSYNWFRYFRTVATIGGTTPVYDYKVEICYP